MSTEPSAGRERARPRAEERAATAFRETHGTDPSVTAWAPGRVNLIGDHTDTSEGYVLPLALGLGVGVALRAAPVGRVRLHSLGFGEPWEGRWDRPAPSSGWERYPLAVACALRDQGRSPSGCDAIIASDLPSGAGLGSSAALGVSIARGLGRLFGFDLDDHGIAHLCRKAENEHVGVRCGIMDPFCSSVGRTGEAVFLDTRTLDHKTLSLPERTRIAVIPTGVRRELSASPYNERREEVERAAQRLGLRSLRDLSPEEMDHRIPALPSPERERTRHVVTENQRVLRAVEALEAGDPARFGDLMNRSHDSLRDDYEVSCAELDTLTAICRALPGCYGARMTGAGFGGSAISLLDAGSAQGTVEEISSRYQDATGTRIDPILV